MKYYLTVEFDSNLEMIEYLNNLKDTAEVKSVWSTPRNLYCLIRVEGDE